MDLTINYNEQMLNYYPEVIKAIREFQLLMETESPKVEEIHKELTKILSNAYIMDADEDRISQWERFLGITPLPQGEDTFETWLQDRRETIMARVYQTPKLNAKSISEIVSIFTGGKAVSYFKGSTVYVLISPPKDNKSFKFPNVEQELKKKIPAHLAFNVSRNYYTWLQIKDANNTWGDVKNNHDVWEDVLYPTVPSQLNLG